MDDASGDRTPEVAERFADRVLRIGPGEGPRGPAHARNRGAAAASGDVLVFVDADVRVRADTLRRLREALRETPAPAAVFGSYDDRPPAGGVISRYRNLLHHHVHQRHRGSAETFWAGCGAVRRDVFEQVGGFDDRRYRRPQIEDIELGRRIRALGHRIELRPQIQVTHLKRWTLASVLGVDFWDRGVAWVRLLLEEGLGASGATLNLDRTERWSAALAVGAVGVSLAALALLLSPDSGPGGVPGPGSIAFLGVDAGWVLLAAAGLWLAGVAVLQADFYRLLWRRGGVRLLLGGAALHLLHYLTAAAAAMTGAALHLYGRLAGNRSGGAGR